jgi:hypothetical protein
VILQRSPIFRATLPGIAADNLPEGFAAEAVDCDLSDGNLKAFLDLLSQGEMAKAASGEVVSIYPMDVTASAGGPFWLHWTQAELGDYATRVDVARGPIPGDQTFRVYIAGLDGGPVVTNITLATTGGSGGAYPYATHKLGVPAPAAAPTVALVADETTPGSIALTNPGAESGSTVGWTVTEGDLAVHDADDVPGQAPYEGNFYFYGGPAAAITEAYQSVDLEAANVLPGQLLLLWWRQATGSNGSAALMGLRFYDAGANLVGEKMGGLSTVAPTHSWAQFGQSMVVPQNAREVRIVMRMERVGAGENDAYIDAVRLEAIGDANLRYDGSTLTDWQIRSAANAAVAPDNGTGWPAPSIKFVSKSGAVAAIYKDIALGRTARVEIEFDYFTAGGYEHVLLGVVIGADADGEGPSISFGSDGVYLREETDWIAIGTSSTQLSAANHRDALFRAEISVERSGDNSALLTWATTRSDTGAAIASGTLTVETKGNYLGFKGWNGNSDSHDGWLDNISIVSTPPDEEAAARDKLVAWVETYVNGSGEESAPSDPSRTVQFSDSLSADITSATSPPAGYDITKKRRYRAAAGTDGAVFRLTHEIDVSTATANDAKDDDELGAVLEPTAAWLPPPADLRGIKAFPNGINAGIYGNQWIPTPRNRPHAWLADATQTTDTDIVAWEIVGTEGVVATQDAVYFVSGADPYQIGMSKPAPGGCVSERSMVVLLGGAVFAGPHGFMLASRGGVDLISEGVIAQKSWDALAPTSIFGIAHRNRYYGFWKADASNKGGFIFDPRRGGDGFVRLSFHATAGYSDPYSGKLYLVIDGDLMVWEGAATKRPYRYRGPLDILPRPAALAVAQIDVERGGADTLTFRLFTDNIDGTTDTFERAITNSVEFNLPPRRAESTAQFELEGTRTVKAWPRIAEDIEELSRG